MNIYIVTNNPFPFGKAATNRILSYTKGFIANNAGTKVICLKPQERIDSSIIDKRTKGIIDGVHYEYSSGTIVRGETFIKRRWLVLKGIIKAFYILKKENARKKIDALIIYSNSFGYIMYFFIISKILQSIYIAEESEYPFVLINTTLIGRLYAKFYTAYLYKVFDAVLVETKTLKEYYKPRIRKNARMMIVPMTVELERFTNNIYQNHDKSQYIAYCGYLSPKKKDGVPILIKAFSIILKKYRNIRLYIIGYSDSKNDLQNLKNLVKKSKIEDEVVFTGKINREEIPNYLCNATILALAKPTNFITTGGLSSKVAEYLATGNPVVLTKIGDITDYLKDGENAFFSEPNSIGAFAKKLDYVLSNPELARKVGQKGKEVALRYFDFRIQAKRVINFINEINEKGFNNI